MSNSKKELENMEMNEQNLEEVSGGYGPNKRVMDSFMKELQERGKRGEPLSPYEQHLYQLHFGK